MNEDTKSDDLASDDQTVPARTVRRPWLFPLLLVALLLAIVAQNRLRPSDVHRGDDTQPPAGPATGKFVSLRIDFGDGSQKQFPQAPWREGMTVFDALAWADHQSPGIDFVYEHTGADAFVQEIDGVANQGDGQTARNWLYEVNGEKGQKSSAVHQLQPSDAILWKFALYD